MINRRNLLKIIPGLPFFLVLPKKGDAKTNELKKTLLLDNFYVAGFQYYDGQTCLNNLTKDELLLLRPEPDNQYDSYAVEIFSGTTKLGYIPRVRNQSFSRMLQAGMPLYARVESVQQDVRPWEAVKVAVYMQG